jgi:hypothetical protein
MKRNSFVQGFTSMILNSSSLKDLKGNMDFSGILELVMQKLYHMEDISIPFAIY